MTGGGKGKVYVGLSGGVDSAVSAALLTKEGYDVTGVFIKIQVSGYPCPAAHDRLDAMRVAAHLKIPFIEVDLSKEYEREVFTPSITEFSKGKTPNPDTLCNEKIKFGIFFNLCRSHGADFVATGHYAQIKNGLLYAGADAYKDQSYFLWMVPAQVLRHTFFPIGHLTKPEVRAYAKNIGLPNADRPDSHGLCFLGDIAIDEMLARELVLVPGTVLNEAGEVVGTHVGAAAYTLGERHGFELFAHTPHTPPHFVVAKNLPENTITVSPHRIPMGVSGTRLSLQHLNWIGALPAGMLQARFRYRQTLIPVTLEKNHQSALLHEPHYVPVGQSLVFYQEGRCVGGGIIEDATLQK